MLVNHLIGIGSATVVVEVLKRAGRDLTRKRFRDEIAKLTDFRSPVYAGPVTCTEADHQCNKKRRLGQAECRHEHGRIGALDSAP